MLYTPYPQNIVTHTLNYNDGGDNDGGGDDDGLCFFV
jgi:hypothetical protein